LLCSESQLCFELRHVIVPFVAFVISGFFPINNFHFAITVSGLVLKE